MVVSNCIGKNNEMTKNNTKVPHWYISNDVQLLTFVKERYNNVNENPSETEIETNLKNIQFV